MYLIHNISFVKLNAKPKTYSPTYFLPTVCRFVDESCNQTHEQPPEVRLAARSLISVFC